MNIDQYVSNFKTKHKEGFTKSEIAALLKDFPKIDMDKFDDALTGITCTGIDNEMVIYHHDVEKALRCGIEKRLLGEHEWD